MTNIVLFTRDRPRLMAQAMRSLTATTPANLFNLTIVDDGSEQPLDYGGKNITNINLGNSGHVLGAVKNLGVYWSEKRFGRGDWLYLSDNDVCFTENWLGKLKHAYEIGKPERFLLIGGSNHPYHQPISTMPLSVMSELHEHGALAGTSQFMKWSTWDKYGPFVETSAPGVCQGEDHALSQRIREDGGKVGAIWPHVVLDTGITQTGGTLSPGWDVKVKADIRRGVIYE